MRHHVLASAVVVSCRCGMGRGGGWCLSRHTVCERNLFSLGVRVAWARDVQVTRGNQR